jgi:hypothetical protein
MINYNDPANKYLDRDDDGLPDYWELLYGLNINDPKDYLLDSDNDGLRNIDEFRKETDPTNPDTDGDGYVDGEDYYPINSKLFKKETPEDNYSLLIILAFCVVFVLILLALMKIFIFRPKHQPGKGQHSIRPEMDSEMLERLRHQLLEGEPLSEMYYSYDEISDMLERKYRSGQMSEQTYKLMRSEILCSEEAGTDNITNPYLPKKK